MDRERLNYLLKKYNNQTATPEQIRIVEDWYDRVNGEDLDLGPADYADLKANVFSQIEHRPFKIHYSKLARAAIFIGAVLGTGYWFLVKQEPIAKNPVIAKQEIKPGGNNAILQLANGTKVVLNSVSDGQISDQQGIKVTKTKNGELVYSMLEQLDTKIAQMNTVSTPRGGQYHLILVDKTEVWLNSGSSITFPAAFSATERKVKVSGEVYFEVAKNKTKPFIVSTAVSEVTVLGTHFNINAYDDEQAEITTLLEGSVSVKRNEQRALLKPGQQAVSGKKSNRISVSDVEDVTAAIAWKNGYFQFDNTDLASLMREISRWYDVDVQYNGKLPDKEYTGKIPKNVGTKELIEMLSYSGIHCSLNNNKIIVNP